MVVMQRRASSGQPLDVLNHAADRYRPILSLLSRFLVLQGVQSHALSAWASILPDKAMAEIASGNNHAEN